MMREFLDVVLLWTIEGTLVLSLAAATVVVCKRWLSPRIRHGLLLGGFGAFALLPLAKVMLPEVWTLPLAINLEEPQLGHGTLPMAEIAPSVAVPKPWFERLPLEEGLILLWLVVVLVYLVGLASNVVAVCRFSRQGSRIECDVILRKANDLADRLGLKRPVLLLTSPEITVPQAWGPPGAMVILPESAKAWPPQRLAMVLAHEMAHCRRRDSLTHCLLQLIVAFQWFNPIVRYAFKRAELEQEMAADRLALGCGVSAGTYSTELLALARQFNARIATNAAAPALLPKSGLRQRVEALIIPSRRRFSRFAAAVATLPGLVGFLGLTMVGRNLSEQPLAAIAHSETKTVFEQPKSDWFDAGILSGDGPAVPGEAQNASKPMPEANEGTEVNERRNQPVGPAGTTEAPDEKPVVKPQKNNLANVSQSTNKPALLSNSTESERVSRPPWPGESQANALAGTEADSTSAAQPAEGEIQLDSASVENLLATNQGFQSLFKLPGRLTNNINLSDWVKNRKRGEDDSKRVITNKRRIVKVIKL